MTWTLIEATSNPDYANIIGYIIAQASQFVILSAVIVGIVNQVKNNLPWFLKQFMWLVAIWLGIGTLFLIDSAFSMNLWLEKVLFFGLIMGLWSVGLYEWGLGKESNQKEQTDTQKVSDDDVLSPTPQING